VEFLYKFVKGHCSKSFGIGVGEMAGIPEKVLIRAE
jgi:DNA mismatch repair ATPase MutS